MKQPVLQTFPLEAFPRQSPSESNVVDRWVLGRIQRALEGASIRFRLWDGFERSSHRPPVATIVINNRQHCLAGPVDPSSISARAHVGRVEHEATSWKCSRRSTGLAGGAATRLMAAFGVERWTPPKTSIPHDLGNAFYRLCSIDSFSYLRVFSDADCGIEAAQIAKMDLVCRLRLVLESVWKPMRSPGAHMAKHYGVRVRAFNLSVDQMAYARQRARAEGLADRVDFIEDDYRNVTGTYDAFVSVGMLEHVGFSELSSVGGVIDRCLSAQGRGLLHFIGRNRPMPLNAWIRKRIFPGAYVPALAEVFDQVTGPWNLSVFDVENLRLHYARTLEHWSRRFEANVDIVREMFDEPFVRAWRLYLAGSQAAFNTGCMQLFQVVFAREGNNAIPWTRNDEMGFDRVSLDPAGCEPIDGGDSVEN